LRVFIASIHEVGELLASYVMEIDDLEKKLWKLRDMCNNPEIVYEHTHPNGYRSDTDDGGFSCYIEQEILFKLGYSSRTILQVNMGSVYGNLLGIVMSVAYGKINPQRGADRIVEYLKKNKKELSNL